MPCDCSPDAAAISATRSLTLRDPSAISERISATSSVTFTPSSEFFTDPSIISVVVLAASALRCARLRTSSATTANPFPASPARAASTAAFSASKLVWKAISSMVFTILAVSSEDCLILPIVSVIRTMAAVPRSADSRAVWASVLAWLEFSEFCLVIEEISSSEEEISSSEDACSDAPSASD